MRLADIPGWDELSKHDKEELQKFAEFLQQVSKDLVRDGKQLLDEYHKHWGEDEPHLDPDSTVSPADSRAGRQDGDPPTG